MAYLGREAVMQALRESAPRAVHLAEICGRVGVARRERDRVLDVLDELSDLGLVKEMPGRRFRIVEPTERAGRGFGRGPAAAALPRKVTDVVRGRLTQHPRGFAFVAAEDGGADVFVPPDGVREALHSDYVAVQAQPTHKGREGHVVEVLGRGLRRLTGTVQRRGKGLWLEPDDPRLPGPMPLRGQVPKGAKAGRAVVAEIVRYPSYRDELPEVRIVDVLGKHGELEVEIEKIKLREGVLEEFSPEVDEEASQLPTTITRAERAGREDLRGYELVTIDPEDARDHDDAVWGQRTADGGFRLLVAIADVAHYVTGGSAMDQEAFARGCSIYLPSRAIPMLPAALSTDLASLVAGEDRLCMAVWIELGPSGAVRSQRLVEGVMRSRASLHYSGVARALGLSDTAEAQPEAEGRHKMLRTLFEASRVLRRRRLRRGALDLDLPEAKVLLDESETEPVDVMRSRKDPGIRQAYQLIEEMMILANEVVAREFGRRGVPTIYRVHGEPDEDKLEIFCQVAASLGYRLTPEEALDPKKLSRFLRRIADTHHAPVLNYLLLRAMQQASYNVTNIGHFGLASRDYLHFTSPIRRYPDLVVHRLARKLVRGEEVDATQIRPELRRAAAEASRLERRAMAVERDAVELYRAALMREREGEEFDGTISHLAEHGFYVAFDEPYVEAVVPVDRLEEDFFELDMLGLRLVGRRTGALYALGDRIRVRVEEVNLSRRDVVAVPLGFVEGEEIIDLMEASTERALPASGRRKPKSPRRQAATPGKRGTPVARTADRARKAREERKQRRRRERRKQRQRDPRD